MFFEQIKIYFHNSRKRVALFWLGIHALFLIAAVTLLSVSMFGSQGGREVRSGIFVLSIFGILAFPMLITVSNPLTAIWLPLGSIPPQWIIIPFYYALFVLLIYLAKDTSSKKFIVVNIIFSFLFIINLIIGLVLVYRQLGLYRA